MQKMEQILVDVGNVQLIDIDRLFSKTRQSIFSGERNDHDFSTLPIHVVEGKAAVFNSDKDEMFLEVWIDHIERIQNGGLVFWHEIELKIAQ